ncbi:ADP-ribose pyrophosphatase YjhB (NUDIX family) [Natranaerovirga hydrolytica]|uniref:ADP-ribose pyrophosphatase YjhB (NUDIX family) n=1 Tax=Natranaerovirga hydrolytica TaxID=680378 RepID=A0A4R1MLJ9_9FIRM|nr:ADP-ribose pyrophosphatase YjhB (NUDIX family) [Natranaerovirga hydrolytica]
MIKKMIHKDIEKIEGRVFERIAARGIVIKDSRILLLYTKRYNDYSFPGGGVDTEEDIITGLKRELKEETGAKNIEVMDGFGYIDEYRPHYKEECDMIHMVSYFYICQIDDELDSVNLEDYEIANGMVPVWVDINEAIKHNKKVISSKEESMGLSIERETLALELVAKELMNH